MFAVDNPLGIFALQRLKGSKENVFLAYRLANYFNANKESLDEINDLPRQATNILFKDFSWITELDTTDLISLYLDFVINEQFNIFSEEDVSRIFGDVVLMKVKQLHMINKIANSKSKIKINKHEKYKDLFLASSLAIKASIILAKLKNLTYIEDSLPIKIYEHYVPIFDTFSNIGDFVVKELRTWLIENLGAIRASEGYIAQGTIFKYFSIIQDKRITLPIQEKL